MSGRGPRPARKILILQLKRIGDVLLTTPLARALHHLFPGARIDFLTEPANHPVLAGNPHLTRLWSYPPRGGLRAVLALARALRAERYDLGIDTLGDPRSVLVGALSGARLRVGYDVRAPRRWAYHKIVRRDPTKYTVDRKLDLVRWMGEVPCDLRPEFHVPEEARAEAEAFWRAHALEGRPVAALSPVSRRPAKRWDPRGFAAVADRLATDGFAILFLRGPGEEAQLAAAAGSMRAAFTDAGAPSIPLLAALIERAAVLVGNDNGMKHLAVALGTPAVTVHTVSRASSWNPPGDPRYVAFEVSRNAAAERIEAIAAAASRIGSSRAT